MTVDDLALTFNLTTDEGVHNICECHPPDVSTPQLTLTLMLTDQRPGF